MITMTPNPSATLNKIFRRVGGHFSEVDVNPGGSVGNIWGNG